MRATIASGDIQLFRLSYRRHRRGVALAESALAVGIILLTLFMVLDFGLAVHRWNTLSEGARRLARAAIVHGATSDDAWGTSLISSTADDGSDYAGFLLPILGASHANKVQYELDWPDGTNELDDHVRVKIQQQYEPISPWLGDTIVLKATTTMPIVH